MPNSESSLVTKWAWLPKKNYATKSSKKVLKITPHHAAGKLSIEGMARVWDGKTVSANYGIENNGIIGQFVHEKDRAYTSCSGTNDGSAITIEVANCKGAPYWEVSDAAVKSLINLCVDICKRNGMPGLTWTGNSKGTLTIHKFFKATACCGPYLEALMPWIAAEVTARVQGVKSGDIVIPKVSFPATKTTTTSAKVATSTNTKATATVNSCIYNGVDLSLVFDYRYYADVNADLKRAFGYDFNNLFMHFCTKGMKEPRLAKATFNVVAYRKNYPDLNATFGDNWVKYYAHYCLTGYKEGRSAL